MQTLDRLGAAAPAPQAEPLVPAARTPPSEDRDSLWWEEAPHRGDYFAFVFWIACFLLMWLINLGDWFAGLF